MVHTCGALNSEKYLNTFYKIPSTNSIFCCWYSSRCFLWVETPEIVALGRIARMDLRFFSMKLQFGQRGLQSRGGWMRLLKGTLEDHVLSQCHQISCVAPFVLPSTVLIFMNKLVMLLCCLCTNFPDWQQISRLSRNNTGHSLWECQIASFCFKYWPTFFLFFFCFFFLHNIFFLLY